MINNHVHIVDAEEILLPMSNWKHILIEGIRTSQKILHNKSNLKLIKWMHWRRHKALRHRRRNQTNWVGWKPKNKKINYLPYHLVQTSNPPRFIRKQKFPLKMKKWKNLRRKRWKCIVLMRNLNQDPLHHKEEHHMLRWFNKNPNQKNNNKYWRISWVVKPVRSLQDLRLLLQRISKMKQEY